MPSERDTDTLKPSHWPENGLEAVPSCPTCGSRQRTQLFDDLTDKIFGCAPGVWTIVQCDDCGLGYLDPRPTAETIGTAYENYYTHEAPAAAGATPPPTAGQGSRLKRWVRACLDGYRNRRYGTRYANASYLGGWLVQLVRPVARYFDASARYLKPASGRNLSVLDIGSGSGKFLHFAKDCGWQTFGLDFDEDAVAVSRQHGLDVKHGTLDLLKDQAAEFDLITSSHVIEHVYSPRSMTDDMFRLVKPGGTVWLETPNVNALGRKRYGADWRGLEPPRHLMLFNRDGLKALLEDSGFVDIRFHNRGLNTFFLYGESELIRQGRRVNARNVRGYISLGSLKDGLIEYFNGDVREFLTVTARRPSS